MPKDFFLTQPPAPDRKDEVAFAQWLERERQLPPIAHAMACYRLTAHDLVECWCQTARGGSRAVIAGSVP